MKTIKFNRNITDAIKAILIALSLNGGFWVLTSIFNELFYSYETGHIITNIIIILIGGTYYRFFIKPSNNQINLQYNKKPILLILLTAISIIIFTYMFSIWYYNNFDHFWNRFDDTGIPEHIRIQEHIDSTDISIDDYININNFYSTITGPISEEIIFRGLLFYGIYKINKPAAYIVSISIFAIGHNGPAIIASSLTGTLYAITYAKTKNLTLCIILHSLNNLFISILLSFSFTTNIVYDKNGYIYSFYNTTTLIIFAIIVMTSFILLCCFSAKRHISA